MFTPPIMTNLLPITITLNRLEFCVGRLECRRYAVTRQTDLAHRAYLAQKFSS